MGLGGVSDVLRGVVVGGLGWEVDRPDSLQCLPGSYRSVTALAWWNQRYQEQRLSYRFLFRVQGHGQGYLLGVLVALDGVDLHLLGRQAQGAEE